MSQSASQETYRRAVELHQAGRLDQAEVLYREILSREPNNADAIQMLGVLAFDKGDVRLAVELLRRAITLKPDAAQYHGNLGMVLASAGRLDDAITAYRMALMINADYPEAQYNLGLALQQAGKLTEAVARFAFAVSLRPAYEDAHVGLGNALGQTGKLDEALASYRRAIELHPRSKAWHSLLYSLHFTDCGPEKLLQEHLRWARACGFVINTAERSHSNSPASDGRLRIGYLSPDFSTHPVGRFMLPLLANHDRREFQVFCYSDVPRPDWLTERLRSHAECWHDTARLSDDELAKLVQRHRIDILVDLAIHTGPRMAVFARKPAPVQLNYLAYCSTSGLRAIDYRLTDRYLDPPGGPEYYTETSIRLPRTYWCYQPLPNTPDVGPPPALRNGYVTFGCLNSFRKVNPAVLRTWGSLLQTVPASRLLLHAHQGSHRREVLEFLQRQGVDPQRIQFAGPQPLAEYWKQYALIDIALDPFPYPGGTTTCDALWMGVPVVSLAGPTAVSRSGLSILSTIGLAELVAHSLAEYVQTCAQLAQNPGRLEEWRRTLRPRMRASPLMDAAQFAQDIESTYRRIWASLRERG